jgi:trigger factor
MQVKELKSKGLNHEMEITVTAADIDKRIDVRLKEVGKTIKMPGFRPGKVPLDILKKRYGKAVMGEVLEQAVNETSNQALADKGLRAAIQPKIEVKEFDAGKDLKYTLAVEVLPKFKIADFKGASLTKLVAKPDRKALDEALARLAENRETTAPVKGDRASKKGDTAVIDFNGRTADDNKEHEGMQAQGHRLKLGSGMFIPGFEDQLTGKKAGDKVEVKVSFPAEYGAKELAGRDAIFDVEIKELHEPSEAKLDDEFAKSFGLEDLKALEKAVEEQLVQEFDYQSRLVLKKSLLDYLDESHDFEIPPTMLDLEFNNILQQVELDRQRNPQEGKDKELSDKEKAEYREIADRRVRLGLLLSEIGRENKIVVSDPELQKAVITEARNYPGQERAVFDYYAKNRNALESLRAPLFENKVVDFILELMKIEDESVTPEELMKAVEGDEETAAPKKTAKKDGGKEGEKAKSSAAAKKKKAS